MIAARGVRAAQPAERKAMASSRRGVMAFSAAAGVLFVGQIFASAAFAADLPSVKSAPSAQGDYDWTGFYVGGHLGFVGGHAGFNSTNEAGVPTGSGGFSVEQAYDPAFGTGSWYGGLQLGYNQLLGNRFLVGVEVDGSANSFVSTKGLSIGGSAQVLNGSATYIENGWDSGTARVRIGYAPGIWLFYATGGLAWNFEKFSLTNNASGLYDFSNSARLGWAVGAGVEVPLIPHWTARLEYLYSDFGPHTIDFPQNGERFTSTLSTNAVRLGVNYQFGDGAAAPGLGLFDPEKLAFHAQATATWQGYPPFSAAFSGPKSLPPGGQGSEVNDVDIFVGYRFLPGLELWFNPEINEGSGLGGTTGVVNYVNNEAYKIGQAEPYSRIQRLFVRDTISLGGAAENIDSDLTHFAQTTTADRLVLTAGRFSVIDIFDTNRYANSPKTQFWNWGNTFNTTLDFATDAWSYSFGGAAEYYFNRFAIRTGMFDMSQYPETAFSPLGYGNDPNFRNYMFVTELEERHDLWGQPGKVKVLGYIDHGPMASYNNAINWGIANNMTPALNEVRRYQSKTGVTLNIEQQVNSELGVFARAGWMDPRYEPYEACELFHSASVGVSIQGNRWGRPQDTWGIAGVTGDASKAEIAYLNAGGNDLEAWDGALPHAAPEKIFETYYNYQMTASVNLNFDYQYVANPAFNTERGPIHLFGAKIHWQF
ncbi:MAG: carbohydrate porin [Xanthobacteraceae bacterium]